MAMSIKDRVLEAEAEKPQSPTRSKKTGSLKDFKRNKNNKDAPKKRKKRNV